MSRSRWVEISGFDGVRVGVVDAEACSALAARTERAMRPSQALDAEVSALLYRTPVEAAAFTSSPACTYELFRTCLINWRVRDFGSELDGFAMSLEQYRHTRCDKLIRSQGNTQTMALLALALRAMAEGKSASETA